MRTVLFVPVPCAFALRFAGGADSICTASSLPSPLWRQALLSALNPPGANRGLAVSQMLLPKTGKRLQVLADLLGASRTCFGTRVTSVLCCTMPILSLGQLAVFWCPGMVFLSCPDLALTISSLC